MPSAAYQAGDEVRSGVLYRRIYPSPLYFSDDRASSLNFSPDKHDGYVSMSLASEVTIPEILEGRKNFGLLEIDAEWLWMHGHTVIYAPVPEIPGHVAVHGFTKNDAQGRRDAAYASRLRKSPTIPKKT